MSNYTPAQIVERYGMQPIPTEGGYFSQTWADEHSSAIMFLIEAPDFSGLHHLQAPEIWFYHAGAPTKMLLLHPDGRIEEPVLGPDLAGGHEVQVAVAPGVWMAAETEGDWSLLGTYMSPPYVEELVVFPGLAEAAERYPAARERLERVCRFP